MTKAIATTKKPNYLATIEAKGPIANTDNFTSEDIGRPIIKLLQGMSSEVAEMDAAQIGHFWHTGADQDLGKEMYIVVISRNKKLLLQAPIDDGQGILARSDDCLTWDRTGSWKVKTKDHGEQVWAITDTDVSVDKLNLWGTSAPGVEPEAAPAATLFYDYLVMVLDGEGNPQDFGPAVLSLARTQLKKARKGLNDKIQMHLDAGRPMQALVFKVTAVSETGATNKPFFNVQFQSSGFAAEATFLEAAELGNIMQKFKVADEGVAVDEEPSAESSKF